MTKDVLEKKIEVVTDANGIPTISLRRAGGHRKKSAATYRRLEEKRQQEELSKKKAGERLLHVLNRRMSELGHNIDDLAATLNISTPYLRALGTGVRNFAKADIAIIKKIASYVDIPVAQALLLADVLSPEDFFYTSVNDEIDKARLALSANPLWMGYAPDQEEWDRLSTRTKLLISMLYETVIGETTVRKAAVPTPSRA